MTRSRRFGKSVAAKMLAAYYDHSCDSRELFADLAITGDPLFEKHLNKYPVIFVDMTTFTAGVAEEEQIVAATGDRFFMIIDEWDAVIRMFGDNRRMKDDFVNLLRRMFKDISAVDVFAGVYMTGILPIKKYKTESALNNFLEYSMVEPRNMSHYFGFTKDEVHTLAVKHGVDFDELEKWYDGYLSFNWRQSECYVPNMEVKGELANAVEENNWEHVTKALQQSDQLLSATLDGDAKAVARMVEEEVQPKRKGGHIANPQEGLS